MIFKSILVPYFRETQWLDICMNEKIENLSFDNL